MVLNFLMFFLVFDVCDFCSSDLSPICYYLRGHSKNYDKLKFSLFSGSSWNESFEFGF